MVYKLKERVYVGCSVKMSPRTKMLRSAMLEKGTVVQVIKTRRRYPEMKECILPGDSDTTYYISKEQIEEVK